MQKKGLGLLIAAAAAYGYYRYSKLTTAQKATLREKGVRFLDENFNFGNLFGKKTQAGQEG